MKRVRINVGKIGVVTKKGDYKRVLTAGAYWLGFSEKVNTYEMSKMYTSDIDLTIMLKDEKFKDLVEVLEVKDNEIALKYEDGNFKSVLASGKYFYWKGLMDFKFIKADLGKVEIKEQIDLAVLKNVMVEKYIRSFDVQSFEEGLLFVDGKFIKKLTKGTYYFWKNAISVSVLKTDMRQLQLEISGQEMLTKDKAALRVNFYTQFKVSDVQKALLDSKDFEKQLYILMQLALREFIGTMTLDEMLDNKDGIAKYVSKVLKEKAEKLGVEIVDCGVRDVILPGDVKDIMNQVLIATKQAQANTIVRREETASTRSLLNTAKLMEDNAMLFKLKEMEYIEKIADRIGEITVSGGGQVVDQLKQIFTK
jgi:regulator of protease activity HflC (stomatin/prohibitin superfamily)